jgi:hypothetical protein
MKLAYCSLVCLQAIETSGFHKENIIHIGPDEQENLSDILLTYSRVFHQFSSFRFTHQHIHHGLPLWSQLGPNLRVLEFRHCVLGEKDLVAVLGQVTRLNGLALVNCRETFMSGNLLSNPAELAVASHSLADLRSLCLDSNKYLSDVLLIRISQAAPRLEHLRSVPSFSLIPRD